VEQQKPNKNARAEIARIARADSRIAANKGVKSYENM
jgi:hypothetical protein